MIKLYLYDLNELLARINEESKAVKTKLISQKAYELIIEKLYEITGHSCLIRKTSRGKPFLENSKLHISISHSDNSVLFAISDDIIGVDIEYLRSFSEHAAKRLFSENEKNYISKGNYDFNCTVLWTMRESVCKAMGEGFSEWFFNCDFVDDEANLVNTFERNGNTFNLYYFTFNDQICTVASVSSIESLEFFHYNL